MSEVPLYHPGYLNSTPQTLQVEQPRANGYDASYAGKRDRWNGYDPSTYLRVMSPPTPYRGTSLIRESASLGLYSRTMPRAVWWS